MYVLRFQSTYGEHVETCDTWEEVEALLADLAHLFSVVRVYEDGEMVEERLMRRAA